jgi:hypothetical protein
MLPFILSEIQFVKEQLSKNILRMVVPEITDGISSSLAISEKVQERREKVEGEIGGDDDSRGRDSIKNKEPFVKFKLRNEISFNNELETGEKEEK